MIELTRVAKQFLGARHHDLTTEMEYIEGMTRIDQDGKRFIDYLGAAHNALDGDEQFLDVLSKSAEIITLFSFESDRV